MKLMILDGNSIVNRTFYGIRMLNSPDGTPTNGIYGFLTILRRLIDEEKPHAVCVAFDLKAPTFRHLQFEAYKAQRKAMPEELAIQIPILKEVLDSLGVKRLELEGYEADDLIGTVSRVCGEKRWECVIVTGDKDSFQLITETTHVRHIKSRMGKTETTEYTPEVFFEEYGFEPKKIIDLKALMGDSSDNIPGVKGIGEKTATELIRAYGTIDKIYSDVDSLEIKDAVKTKLVDGKPDAEMSFSLATIELNVPIDFSPENCVFSGDFGGGYEIFRRLGFNSLIEKWGITEKADGTSAPKPAALPIIEVNSETELTQLSEKMRKLPHIAVLPLDGGLDALELCDGNAVFILRWANLGDNYNSFLKELFSQQVHKLSHNNKDFMGRLMSENLDCRGFDFDTALAAYLLAPTESGYELERISAKYLGDPMHGSEAIFALYPVLKARLDNEGMTDLLEKIELPLCEVISHMEQVGFAVDKQAIFDFGKQLSIGIEALQKDIWSLAGEEFNINSPKQLGEILFEKLMLPYGKKTKTGWSTNADVLDGLRGKHEIIDKISEYRQLTKLKSTYCDGLIKVVGSDGRIHTSFQMTVTATGRLSSTEPNLQNIPVRTELGAQLRKMFVASNGNLLVDADYSQIELRLLAHISGDETMKNAFKNGEDIHAVTASQVLGIPLAEVTKLQRSRAKAVNFGIVYGISAFSLAQDIGVYQSEAKAYIDTYLEKYSGVRGYMDGIKKKAKDDGYVATLFGRRRPLPELKSANFNLRSFGERVALNTPIQGTAADIIKLAMVNVHRRLESEGLGGKLILQIHDELIVECPEKEAETVKKILTQEMENAVRYSVPLDVDANIGKSWSDAK
ncbi:MAG: DNA polymerase I [Firmicutes bacterium HGW-Firmicutes-16]|nr:MAG: DNA polymerase I [Firmicutes bacterium HGW-Firmicutes-16]